ncbi:MAG: multifunctional 2',3'-cyclic-nucleotide 2'-phosphodiesterase/5'-nucleotidase/3'-nucleotidase, partial [Alphaproteobacteria bacterium HGW-Alphaproteobacteria-8]
MSLALRAATALTLSLTAAAAQADFSLTILHVNDFHSRVEAINRFDSTCSAADDAEGKCFGGLARLSTAVADARAAAGNAPILFLNAGDIFQGSLYYTTYKGLAEAELFNGIGVDAMALGNHEFDNGPETLAAFIDKVHFPVLSGNTWLGDEPALKGKTQGYLILDV